MLLCEAAGYDVVLVETVGIGQSETAVAEMTDFFLVLMLPGAGDELQGLKKGVVELADMLAVNKADGDNLKRAKGAAAEYSAALHILTPRSPKWTPPVVTYSALTGDGVEEIWRACAGASRAHDRVRRACGAPPRAAGEMDVDHARRARDGAAALRPRRAGEAQGYRERRRGRPAVADARRGPDRGIARTERAMRRKEDR